jgi:hypothetical protein
MSLFIGADAAERKVGQSLSDVAQLKVASFGRPNYESSTHAEE